MAEMGTDMSRFPTAGHLCAWAGVAPASHESAGKRRPDGTRHGSTWLQRAHIEASRAAARTKGSYFSAQYSRIARRRGPNKAAVAVAHSILAVTWHLLTTGTLYEDPGARYFEQRHDPAIERSGSRSGSRPPATRSSSPPAPHRSTGPPALRAPEARLGLSRPSLRGPRKAFHPSGV